MGSRRTLQLLRLDAGCLGPALLFGPSCCAHAWLAARPAQCSSTTSSSTVEAKHIAVEPSDTASATSSSDTSSGGSSGGGSGSGSNTAAIIGEYERGPAGNAAWQ